MEESLKHLTKRSGLWKGEGDDSREKGKENWSEIFMTSNLCLVQMN